MTDVTADRLVSAYMKIRNAIQEKEKEIKHMKEQQTTISAKLLELCSEQGMDSIRTQHGTASRRT